MKRPEQNRLLEEILPGPELSEFRQASLDQALTSLRRRHQRRRVARACLLSAMPLALILGLFLAHLPGLATRLASLSSSGAATQGLIKSGDIQLINDDELLALFPDRSVALIGKPGHQQLVFLDRAADRRNLQESAPRLQ